MSASPKVFVGKAVASQVWAKMSFAGIRTYFGFNGLFFSVFWLFPEAAKSSSTES
jgi:hypothetical protein